MFNIIAQISEKDLNQIVKPLLDVLGVVVPVLLGVIGSLGAIWVIFLGVKYAKAEDPQEHEKARNSLKNAIIGFVLIFVLLIALQFAVTILTDWYKNYEFPA
jgi:threonine/homoserine/homoserine lactone efflux protein